MIVNLNTGDITNLILGIVPYYSVMEHPLIAPHGQYTGGFNDQWNWNQNSFNDQWNWNQNSFNGISEEKLWDIYIICAKSHD